MKNWICKLFGHKISCLTDSGFELCDRCKAHEYYDSYEFESEKWKNAGIIFVPITWLKIKIADTKFKKIQKDELPF